ncbi:GPI-anchor transamidase subunit GAA1 [Ascoidea rubescens DSM 1968]|uniref:Glycosylphosphatidylinositol:protein transamidase, GAA1 component n=1 Tax=Ascoidea rubescens DSM 1968 TaxID=1344418 RepID=A0A1D2VQ80_9ASCO|nr:Glycosylphosphatidylinositol:protein transamidase, GAA1 component [Ascoidea rubescens DSM 1968]ODV63744.1 Glycosylphosphatidylinositol:protein transamidase, GAA1 component [Ascoidea rubescens DSM 1968]
MALLEQIRRKVYKLGLVPKITKRLPLISFLLGVLSCIWILYLPVDGQYRRTYISENALMPSQAYSYFRESEWNYERGYRDEIHKLKDIESIFERNKVISEWLEAIGLNTAVHQFHYNDANKTAGHNLYGLFHAPRGDGTEAMVLAASWNTPDGEFNEGGVALVVSLARYFSRWSIWSKNIIFVITEDSHYAMRSWVQAYHISLDLTGGAIEAAVILEYPGEHDYFKYVEVIYGGLNGQLPNLDLVNTAVSITEHEGVKVSVQKVKENELNRNDYFSRCKVLLSGIKELAFAGLKKTNGCEAFSGWRIQALTLRAKGYGGGADITTFGRVPEAMFRSINNLLEKFHQSFFFYLMLSPRNFVSIGTYLPSAVLLTVSFGISSASIILNSKHSESQILMVLPKSFGLFTISFFISSLLGVSLMYIPVSPDIIFRVLMSSGIILSSQSLNYFNYENNIQNKTFPMIRIKINLPLTVLHSLLSITLLYTSLVITSLLVVHFSIAFLIGICLLPLTFVRPLRIGSESLKLRSFVNFLCLVISCPWTIILVIGVLDKDFGTPFKVMEGLLTSWRDFEVWTWFIITFGWLPVWLEIFSYCVIS